MTPKQPLSPCLGVEGSPCSTQVPAYRKRCAPCSREHRRRKERIRMNRRYRDHKSEILNLRRAAIEEKAAERERVEPLRVISKVGEPLRIEDPVTGEIEDMGPGWAMRQNPNYRAMKRAEREQAQAQEERRRAEEQAATSINVTVEAARKEQVGQSTGKSGKRRRRRRGRPKLSEAVKTQRRWRRAIALLYCQMKRGNVAGGSLLRGQPAVEGEPRDRDSRVSARGRMVPQELSPGHDRRPIPS